MVTGRGLRSGSGSVEFPVPRTGVQAEAAEEVAADWLGGFFRLVVESADPVLNARAEQKRTVTENVYGRRNQPRLDRIYILYQKCRHTQIIDFPFWVGIQVASAR